MNKLYIIITPILYRMRNTRTAYRYLQCLNYHSTWCLTYMSTVYKGMRSVLRIKKRTSCIHEIQPVLLVRSMGLEPIWTFVHYPLKVARLPFRHDRIYSCWCSGTELNRRHGDFQSPALPTELPEQIWRPRSDLNRRSSPWQGDMLNRYTTRPFIFLHFGTSRSDKKYSIIELPLLQVLFYIFSKFFEGISKKSALHTRYYIWFDV